MEKFMEFLKAEEKKVNSVNDLIQELINLNFINKLESIV